MSFCMIFRTFALAPQGSGWMDDLIVTNILVVSGICRVINKVHSLGNDIINFLIEYIAIK